jgi:hypothetical protein
VTLLSRTIGDDRVVDELIASFTHTPVMGVCLPGIEPTGRYVELPHVVVAGTVAPWRSHAPSTSSVSNPTR